MRELIVLLMMLVTGAQLVLVNHRLAAEKTVAETKQNVKRLASLTLDVFHGQDPPEGASLWAAIGRTSPMVDPWGQEYRMEVLQGQFYREYIWVSAGPDRVMGSQDDLKARVPFQHGNGPDLTRPEISPEGSTGSTEAL
jgi:hypothetical protein